MHIEWRISLQKSWLVRVCVLHAYQTRVFSSHFYSKLNRCFKWYRRITYPDFEWWDKILFLYPFILLRNLTLRIFSCFECGRSLDTRLHFLPKKSCAPLGLELPQPLLCAPPLIFLTSAFRIFNNNFISFLSLMVGQESYSVRYFNTLFWFFDCFDMIQVMIMLMDI